MAARNSDGSPAAWGQGQQEAFWDPTMNGGKGGYHTVQVYDAGTPDPRQGINNPGVASGLSMLSPIPFAAVQGLAARAGQNHGNGDYYYSMGGKIYHYKNGKIGQVGSSSEAVNGRAFDPNATYKKQDGSTDYDAIRQDIQSLKDSEATGKLSQDEKNAADARITALTTQMTDQKTGYAYDSAQEQAYNQQQQTYNQIQGVIQNLQGPPDFNSPYYQNILNNVQSRASQAASMSGVQGGLAASNITGQLTNAEANLTMDRQNQYMSALGMGAQQTNYQQSFEQAQQAQDQNYKLNSTNLQAQLNSANRQQQAGVYQTVGAGIGGVVGGVAGAYAGGPMGAASGAAAGAALGGAAGGGIYNASHPAPYYNI